MFGSVSWIHHWYLSFECVTWICSWSRWCDLHSVAREHVLPWWEQQLVFTIMVGTTWLSVVAARWTCVFWIAVMGYMPSTTCCPLLCAGRFRVEPYFWLLRVGPSDCFLEWRNEHSCSEFISLRWVHSLVKSIVKLLLHACPQYTMSAVWCR